MILKHLAGELLGSQLLEKLSGSAIELLDTYWSQ